MRPEEHAYDPVGKDHCLIIRIESLDLVILLQGDIVIFGCDSMLKWLSVKIKPSILDC